MMLANGLLSGLWKGSTSQQECVVREDCSVHGEEEKKKRKRRGWGPTISFKHRNPMS
jgi:hypothetical protein